MKNILIGFIIIFCSLTLIAQDESKVLVPELKGSYNGEVKKGLAHGNGEATGQDHYKGEFKKGLPHGEGTYTWSNGQVYEGAWKKGVKEGYGKLTFNLNGKDSTIEGYFYQDKFLGDKKRPDPDYSVKSNFNIARYSFRSMGEDIDRVIIYFDSQGRIPEDLRFQQSSGVYRFETPTRVYFEKVEFPFTLSVIYKIDNQLRTSKLDCRITFVINKSGIWEVKLSN